MKNFNIYTTGVYGLSSEEFFERILSNQIDTFVDIRRRRAVRGSKFAFVNSQRLQDKLKEIGVNYLHILDLAPTNEIREAQKEADKKAKVKKRERDELGEEFKNLYKKEILEKYHLEDLLSELNSLNAKNVVLFCVEKEPCACHRSLVTDEINAKYQIPIKHL
jgi:uncharacterized protein (DUF488 family)